MLKLTKVTKGFTQRGIVLDDLDLEIAKGDTVAITGPSGSGKTTLLNLIGLLDRPDSGTICFMDNLILDFNPAEAASYRNNHIGFVFQDHLLLPHLTIMENVLLPLLAGKRSASEFEKAEAYAKELMKKVGIEPLGGKYPFMVSGGEAQRASLVRALINHPSILLADEPTGALDADNAKIMGDLLIEINRSIGISLILATHSLNLAQRMAKNYSLEKGKIKSS